MTNNKEIKAAKETAEICLMENLTITAALKDVARKFSNQERNEEHAK
ncbi:hypothetical protein [uncultured Clostridium sp.]|nr:hypothetical protein [uncultured Clostridium sp.]